jgi:hypothetical protein
MELKPDPEEALMSTQPEDAVQRAAAAIASVIMRGGDHIEAARAALEAAQPSPAMAERAARLLLTKRGDLPEVHAAWREPLEPFCGNPDGFGPGGYSTHTLRITCRACTDKFGNTEDQLAEWERRAREGLPPGYVGYKPVRTPTGWEFVEHVHG